MFASNLSASGRARIERITGVSTRYVVENQRAKGEIDPRGSSTTRVNDHEFRTSLHSDPSQLESGVYQDTAPWAPKAAANRPTHGMAADHDIALANLDPRTRDMRPGQSNKRLGVSANAVADESSPNVPEQGIGISRDWRLYSE